MPTRVRVVIDGHVQGVFFRATARDTARDLGLTGFVRNRRDGRVEAEFQGPPQAVDTAVAFCREGPPYARVTNVQVDQLDAVEGEHGFRVE